MKEKLDRDSTDQQEQDSLNGKTEISDEMLDMVSGGTADGDSEVSVIKCPKCGSKNVTTVKEFERYIVCLCNGCGKAWQRGKNMRYL